MLNFNVIVFTTDLSDYSMRALPYAVSLAERFEARLKVVYVNEPIIPVSDIAWQAGEMIAADAKHQRDARTAIEKAVREQVQKGIDVEVKIFTGKAVDRIVEYANEVNADLLVLCTHGRSGVSHLLMGSTAEAVVRRAPCPVLTLKQPMPVAACQTGR